MQSGRATLAELDRSMAQARQRLDALGVELEASTRERGALEHRRLALLRTLAAFRLDDLERRELTEALDGTDAAIAERLRARAEAIESLNRAIAADQEVLANAEAQRDQLAGRVAQATAGLDEAEAQAQAALAEDAGYQQQLEAARVAEHKARAAAEKADTARIDRDEKRKPYDADPLFGYLWRRGYGTPEYRGWGMTRLLDGWVARVCRYEQARPNYHRLLDIPERLLEHAARVEAAAQAEAARLQPLEEAALARAGADERKTALAEAEQRLEAFNAGVEQAERSLAERLERRSAFLEGSDPELASARQSLTGLLERASIGDLLRHAERTPSPADDKVVDELADVTEELKEIEQSLAEQTREHRAELERLKEMLAVRRRFRAERYDDFNSGFANAAVLGTVLGQVLGGAKSGDDLWDVLARNRRYAPGRADPCFGSGRFPNAPRTWRRPPASKPPRSGGGFKTGGSF